MTTAEPSYYGGGILTTGEDEFAEKDSGDGGKTQTYPVSSEWRLFH